MGRVELFFGSVRHHQWGPLAIQNGLHSGRLFLVGWRLEQRKQKQTMLLLTISTATKDFTMLDSLSAEPARAFEAMIRVFK